MSRYNHHNINSSDLNDFMARSVCGWEKRDVAGCDFWFNPKTGLNVIGCADWRPHSSIDQVFAFIIPNIGMVTIQGPFSDGMWMATTCTPIGGHAWNMDPARAACLAARDKVLAERK